MRTSSTNTRLEYIDIAKGIGIILVIIGHNIDPYTDLLKFISAFHMPSFFFVTGYLFSEKNYEAKSKKRILQSRLFGIMYPYFILSLLIFIASAINNCITKNSTVSLVEIALKTITTYGYHSMWFLPTFSIASLAFIFTAKKSKKICLLLPIICLSFWFITAKISTNYSAFWTGFLYYTAIYISRVCMAIVFIFSGFYFQKILNRIEQKFRYKYLYVILTIVFIAIYSFTYKINYIGNECNNVNMSSNELGNPILFLIIALIGCVSVLFLSKYIIKKCSILEYFGKNSLLYMALHMDIVAYIVKGIFNGLKITDHIPSVSIEALLNIVLNITITTIFTILINKFFPYLITIPPMKGKKNDT